MCETGKPCETNYLNEKKIIEASVNLANLTTIVRKSKPHGTSDLDWIGDHSKGCPSGPNRLFF